MTSQQNMQAKLAKAGIPYKEIKCYGSQIMVTAWCQTSAEKWRSLLSNFAKIRGMGESVDYNLDSPNTSMIRNSHIVWRVWATI